MVQNSSVLGKKGKWAVSCMFPTDIGKFPTTEIVLKITKDFRLKFSSYMCIKITWKLLMHYIHLDKKITHFKVHSATTLLCSVGTFSEFASCRFFQEYFRTRRKFSDRENLGWTISLMPRRQYYRIYLWLITNDGRLSRLLYTRSRHCRDICCRLCYFQCPYSSNS